MKITKRLLPFLLILVFILSVILPGCAGGDKTSVEAVIISELDLLKNLDSKTTQKYISYKELFPDAAEDIKLSAEIKEVFSLFFRNFDYKILDINVDKKKKTAEASVSLTTIDARKLAQDYARAQLEAEILGAADAGTQNTEEITTSLEDRYLILHEVLDENEYETVQTNCTMQLHNVGDEKTEIWEIKRTHSLENDLVGSLITYLSDSNLLSPEEILTIYINALKKMNVRQMSAYLCVGNILNTDDTDKNAIANALVEKIDQTFDCTIKDSSTDSYKATVTAEITVFDIDAILNAYQDELETYLATPDAVIDGSSKRYDKSLDFLLSHIESSDAVKTVETTFELINDGVSWRLQNGSQALGSAIFGTFSSSIVEDNFGEITADDDDTDYDEDYENTAYDEDYEEAYDEDPETE